MITMTMQRGTGLTPRQREVVALIAAGCSNDEVGERLGISPRTAKAHSDTLRSKLGVSRRRQIPVAFRVLTARTRFRQASVRSIGHRGSDGKGARCFSPAPAGAHFLE